MPARGATEVPSSPSREADSSAALRAAVRRAPPIDFRQAPAPPLPVGAPINSPFVDFQPALSRDALTLFFTSNRPEGNGDPINDQNIWVARRACAVEGSAACAGGGPALTGRGVIPVPLARDVQPTSKALLLHSHVRHPARLLAARRPADVPPKNPRFAGLALRERIMRNHTHA